MAKKNLPREAAIQAAARRGLSNSEIAALLGISRPVVWTTLNRSRYNANARESAARYQARGCIALCDLPESPQ